MTVNLTPAIQTQIYMDKKDGHMLSMVEALTPKVDYQPEDKKTKTSNDDEEKNSSEKKEPYFSDAKYGFNSYQHKQNLNSSISTQGFFDTLSSSSGNVQKAS